MLRPEHSALGVGAGRECLIFYLADRLREVVASDLYGNKTWSTNIAREATREILQNPGKFCPRAFRGDHLQLAYADGTQLQFDANRFDICWSMSSIEHFGGHEKASQAVSEMARVTRPGGVLAIATEYLLLPEYQHPEYFTREEIARYLIDRHALPEEYLTESIIFPAGIHRVRRHVVLNDGQVQWTSILLLYRKR